MDRRTLRVLIFTILFPLLASGIASCAASDEEVDGSLFCNINQTETYQIGTSPAVDFNVTNLQMATSFNQANCPDINTDSFSTFVSRVKRTGDILTVFDNQYQGNQMELTFNISGTELDSIRNVFTINNCSIVRTWTGEISPGTNEVILNENIDYKGLCNHVFILPIERPDN